MAGIYRKDNFQFFNDIQLKQLPKLIFTLL
jgi:hypothetical protein